MTPLLITTSAQPSSTGSASARPSRNSTLCAPSASAVSVDFFSISLVMSTPTTVPFSPTWWAATKESNPAPEPDVEDPLAGVRTAQRERVPDASEGLHCPIGQGVDDHLVVAEALRERSAGVEVIALTRSGGDGAVLLPHLVAKNVGIDRHVLGHLSLPLRSQRADRHASIPGTRLRAAGPGSPACAAGARPRPRRRNTGPGSRRPPRHPWATPAGGDAARSPAPIEPRGCGRPRTPGPGARRAR